VYAPAVPRIDARVTHPFAVDDALPGGLQAIATDRTDEVILWITAHRALVVGDALLGDGRGGIRVPPDDWFEDAVSQEEYREKLGTLLELPVERVLLAHGDPILADGHAALAQLLGSRA
jgi:hypothetical protein